MVTSIISQIMKICIFLLVLAVLDYIYQRWQLKKSLRMTKKEVQDETLKASGKVELALEELDKFSRSDIDDLGFERQPDESDKETEKVEVVSSDDAFATESAAILYLKQGLYDEAKEIYGKLYRSLDEKIFMEKIGKVKRVEKANLKINALEEFLEKIKTGSVRIV